jgi:hypothetical protein
MLDLWMKTAGVDDGELSRVIGQTRQSVGYYRRGERCMDKEVQKKVVPFLIKKIREKRDTANEILEPIEAVQAA